MKLMRGCVRQGDSQTYILNPVFDATVNKRRKIWQQGVTSLVFQELTDVWPDPIFVPKVAIA